MLERKIKYKKGKIRSSFGAIIAENASVMYVLFLLIFFPLVDLAAIGLRMFFLWYSCNQAAMAGSKGTQWTTGNSNGISSGNSYSTSIQTQATTTLTKAVAMFSGISVTGSPQLSVILTAINHSDTANNQSTASSVTLTSGSLPLTSGSNPPVVDPSQYVPILRVTVNGSIQPFLPVPFFIGIPGLSSPFPVTINADQQIENAMALNS